MHPWVADFCQLDPNSVDQLNSIENFRGIPIPTIFSTNLLEEEKCPAYGCF